MDIAELDVNAVCLGILCNFPQFCGEERAKEAAELVRALYAERETLRADLARVTAERDAAKSPEVLEAVDELVEFARTRMCIADWLYYVEVLGEWRGDDIVVERNWVDHKGTEGPEGKED